MTSTLNFRPKLTVAALSVSMVCAVLSFFTLNSMNLDLVHSKLYSYGLTYNPQWANPYGLYLNLSLATIAATMVFAALSLTAIAVAVKRSSIQAKKLSATFSVLTLLAAAGSLILFLLTYGLIDGEMYSFGLKFNRAWFSSYQVYFAEYVILQATVIALTAASFPLFSSNPKKPKIKISAQKIIFPTLLSIGSLLIGIALIYDYLAAFFGGFALLFWGSIMVFISGERLIKKDVLDATSLTYLSQLRKTANSNDNQNMVYVAPNGLSRIQAVSKSKVQQIQNVELTLFKTEQLNMAPENELFQLIEQKLGKSFSQVSFLGVKTVLPKLLVESLELAQNMTVQANGDTVNVSLENPYDLQVYLKSEKQNRLIDAAGSPLSGAIAYALANSSGKPVIVNQILIGEDKKTLHITYTLLGLRSELA
ncbi:MAG: hypothetical protein ACFCUE_00785 [Candidatus Bathyarchaeia archaeon]|jgi:hypothetical protein